MKRRLCVLFCGLFSIAVLRASPHHDVPVAMVKLDRLEYQDAEGDNPLVLDGQAWVGTDLHKLWLKTEIEYVNGDVEESELQLLYSRAVAPCWDLQLGVRQNFQLTPERSWAVIGFQGLSPYYFEVEAALYIGEHGQTEWSVDAERELLLTQKWVLTPEIGITAYGKDDNAQGVGSGLSEVEAGLRLRYEIRREIAPYIGLEWSRYYRKTADFAELEGEDRDQTRLVVGIRAWF